MSRGLDLHISKRSLLICGLMGILFILSLSRAPGISAMDIPKDNRIAVSGNVVDIKSMPREGTEKTPDLVVIVIASNLINRQGKQEVKNELWVFKVPPDRIETFRRYKMAEPITAYGYRETKGRILRVLDEGLGPFSH